MSTKKSRQNQKRAKRSNRGHSKQPPTRQSTALEPPKPKPVEGESTEDRALFDPVALEELPEALQTQARLVISALDCTYRGNFEAANNQLREIPRASPFADWRMFVRGLTAWYVDDFASASQSWHKLDPTRRPARIAAVLSASLPKDDSLKQGEPDTSNSAAQPSSTLESAQQIPAPHFDISSKSSDLSLQVNQHMVDLLAQLRLTRPALRLARKIADIKHRDPDMTLSALQVSLLMDLRQGFGEADSELVEQMTEACVNLAWQQPDTKLFKLLVNRLPGPAYDPHWSLTLAGYYGRFEDARKERGESFRKYMESDLPNNHQIDPKLQSALASAVLEQMAEDHAANHRSWRDDIGFLKKAEIAFGKAVEAWPANRDAHLGILNCIERILEAQSRSSEPLKKEREEADAQAAAAYANWLTALPDEIAPRLWLIDYYLANENPAAASDLVKKLPISSLENLRIKMIPWKIKLTEVLVAAQKKRGIPLAEVSLEGAIAVWPKWLAQDFVPFLRAGLKVRGGNGLAFESVEIRSLQDSGLPPLVSDVMTLAAAQMMSVESSKLKQYRSSVEQHVKGVEQLSTNDLARLGSFFWDLKLWGMSYPALRMHGSKFGTELCSRIKSSSQPDVPGLIQACLWMSEARFYANSGYDESIPKWLERRSSTDPLAAAAILRSHRLRSYAWRHVEQRKDQLALVEQAVKTESRPVERLIMEEAIKLSHDILEEGEKNRAFDPFSSFFGSWMPSFFGDDDDDDDDTCMCPNCVARRARQQGGEYEDDEYEDDEYDDDDYDDDDDDDDDDGDPATLQFRVIMEKIGDEALQQISELMEMGSRQDRDVMPEVREILRRRGVTQQEFQEALRYTQRQDSPPKPPLPPPMSAEERRRNDKQRKKMLEQSRKRK